jgi:small subunit ribosomal protein S15
MYNLENASSKQLVKMKVAKAIRDAGKQAGDTGSTAVQIAVLNQKILNLSEHTMKNRKDKHSRRGLDLMMEKRRKLLQYLKRKDFTEYRETLQSLKLRPVAGIR